MKVGAGFLGKTRPDGLISNIFEKRGPGGIRNHDGLPDLSGPSFACPSPETALRENTPLQGAIAQEPEHQQQKQRESTGPKKNYFASEKQLICIRGAGNQAILPINLVQEQVPQEIGMISFPGAPGR